MPDDAAFVKQNQPFFKRTPLRDLAKRHPGKTPWLVRKYFPAKSIITIFGESGSGKTTVVADVVASIDTGMDWRGHKVNRGIVWYIAAEDPHGVRLRFEAWYQDHHLNFTDSTNIEIIELPVCFADAESVNRLIHDVNSALSKPSVIVLDTLSDSADCFDLNSDMGLFMRGFERLRKDTGCSIIIIHHCGHAAKDRPRNGSELIGKSDVIMPVKCEDGITTLSCSKMKNASKLDAKPLSWTLKPVKTQWIDDDEEVITSVVMESTEKQESPCRLSRPQRIALDELGKECARHDDGWAYLADWRKAVLTAGISKAVSKQGRYEAFNRARSELLGMQLIEKSEEKYRVNTVNTVNI